VTERRLTIEVAIRQSTAADVDALVELDLASARHHAQLDPATYHVPDRADVAAFLERRLADPERRVLVAVVDEQVVGMIDVTKADPPDAGSIIRHVVTVDLGISVAEAWRGRGIGHEPMAAAESVAREVGAARVILDMSAANTGALRFYRRLGYREHGLFLHRDLTEPPA
jgi:GNAT superfamily N-acetyltransferase